MTERKPSFADKLSLAADKINSLGILSKTPDKRTVAIAFFVLLFIIGTFSGVLIALETKEDTGDTTTSTEDTALSSQAVSGEVKEIDGNFLLVLGDGDNIDLLSVVGLNSSEKKIRIAFIDSEGVCLAGDKTATFERHFKDGGITKLLEAVSTYADIEICKYVLGDEDAFTGLVRDMGEFYVDVEEKVDSSHDGVSFIIEKGEQVLIPDMMLKYFLYLCENQPQSYVKLSKLMMQFGEKLFSAEDEVLERNINSFISSFDTDVSALDFSEYKQAVKKLAEKEVIDGMIIEGQAYHLGETTLMQ